MIGFRQKGSISLDRDFQLVGLKEGRRSATAHICSGDGNTSDGTPPIEKEESHINFSVERFRAGSMVLWMWWGGSGRFAGGVCNYEPDEIPHSSSNALHIGFHALTLSQSHFTFNS
jgi:hypothetical protein